MPNILSLEMQGFKSFATKTKLTFPDGLVVIVGPNGSGKTNIMDAICFVLGKKSKKELRAERLAHLIFNGGKGGKSADFSRVALNLDNSKKEFPYSGKIFQISRSVDKDGVSTFRINGNRCTLAEVKNALLGANINPDGFNIIMQGEIARLAEMSAVERRQIIEDIAGIMAYEEKKGKALNELQKVEDKIKEGGITLKEKKKYLDELSVEKLQAEKFLRKKQDLEKTQGMLILKRLNNRQTDMKKLSETVERIQKEQRKFSEKIDDVEKEIKTKENEISDISNRLEKGGEDERIKLEKEIALLQDELNDLDVLVRGHRKEIERLNEREKQLNRSLLDNREELNKMKLDENRLEKTISELKSGLSERKNLMSKLSSSDYFKLKSDFNEIGKEIIQQENVLRGMQEKWKKRIDLEELEDSSKDIKNQLKGLKSQESEKLVSLKDIQKKKAEVEQYLSHLKVEKVRLEERRDKEWYDNTSIKWIIGKGFDGVIGVLSGLIKTDDQVLYSLVQSKNGIVVENAEIAKKCINSLKKEKAGIVRFYPLDVGSIKKSSVSSKFDCDAKYRQLFEALFRDVSASEDGVVDGLAIVGGYRSDEKEVDLELRKMNTDLEKYAQYLNEINENLDSLDKDISLINKKKYELEKDLGVLDEKRKDFKSILSSVSEEAMGKTKSRISELGKREREINLQLEKTSGVSEEEIEKIDSEIRDNEGNLEQLSRQLIEVQMRMDNIVKKDISSFESILASITKDRERFENDIAESEKRIGHIKKEFKQKKAAERDFYNKLQSYFNARDKLRKALSGLENKRVKLEQKTEAYTKEIQDSKIRMAEMSAIMEGLRERLKDFKGMEIPGTRKDEKELELEVRELERAVNSFGAVNMKALETFKEIESEYNKLNEKILRLEEERQEILSMIDEIEGKKRGEFLRTFKEINKNLGDIFSTLSPGGTSKLVLENEEEPFEGGIDVFARPMGKKMTPMRVLSGGEKTLVALAFIFSIQEYHPAPFYIMDEIDAALDKYNSEKLSGLLDKYSKKGQFIIISHNDEIISNADYMYGVSMRDNGISNVVSIKLPE